MKKLLAVILLCCVFTYQLKASPEVSIPIPNAKPAFKVSYLKEPRADELVCLAKAVYHESRGEPIEGQVAVAFVVLNRAKSEKYPDHICDVIHQPFQFTDIRKTKPNTKSPAWRRALQVALVTYRGQVKDPTHGSKYFFAHNLVRPPKWAREFKFTKQIGGHKFYKEKVNDHSTREKSVRDSRVRG